MFFVTFVVKKEKKVKKFQGPADKGKKLPFTWRAGMKRGKWSFLLGVALAGILAITVFDVQCIEAISRAVTWANLSPEIKSAHDLGICEISAGNLESLRYPVRRKDFSGWLLKTFSILGIDFCQSPEEVEKMGILSKSSSNGLLSRKESFEALCRTLIFLSERGLLKFVRRDVQAFPDYQPQEKYRDAMQFLLEEGIFRGYRDGKFNGNRTLSRGEAITLFYRMFNRISAIVQDKQTQDPFWFSDIPPDHPIVQSIRTLAEEGAFEYVKIGKSFAGKGTVTNEQMAGMISGILKKYERMENLGEVQKIVGFEDSKKDLTREKMVLFLGVLVDTFDGIPGMKFQPAYSDVRPGSRHFSILQNLSLLGVRIGPGVGKLSSSDVVTRFEVIGTLERLKGRLKKDSRKDLPSDLSNYPTRTDFEEFVNLIKAKQARIRLILHRRDKPRS